jgi:hypothetical protein
MAEGMDSVITKKIVVMMVVVVVIAVVLVVVMKVKLVRCRNEGGKSCNCGR